MTQFKTVMLSCAPAVREEQPQQQLPAFHPPPHRQSGAGSNRPGPHAPAPQPPHQPPPARPLPAHPRETHPDTHPRERRAEAGTGPAQDTLRGQAAHPSSDRATNGAAAQQGQRQQRSGLLLPGESVAAAAPAAAAWPGITAPALKPTVNAPGGIRPRVGAPSLLAQSGVAGGSAAPTRSVGSDGGSAGASRQQGVSRSLQLLAQKAAQTASRSVGARSRGNTAGTVSTAT